ncbi:MRG/MORF4L-binding protein [Holothuria leucospilota]|uniref:MRG/MORF4L-binding protein n=1 Tax=Holothuria leucospilota TaxID=206669 RepID=A0A9Q1BV39_HOLLE|nr:MRG/MORF4L-binding protein [Holothuria leucospilota]
MAGGGDEEQPVQWGPEMEVALFYAMRKHKPVGINKNFHMMCIYENLMQCSTIKVSSKQIWEHLGTMYDMQALHESEVMPFSNSEENFELPEQDYGDLKKEKAKNSEKASVHDDDKKETKTKTSSSGQQQAAAEKEGGKRKRTRQSAGTPNEAPTSKRRR